MRFLQTTLATLLLGGSLYASPLFYTSFDDDFHRIDRYFDSLMNSYHSKYFSPKMELYDNKENYVVEFEVQGIEKNDLKLTLEENNILKLTGEKKSPKTKPSDEKKEKKYYGTFTKMIQLPDDANGEKISTEHKNGILTVTIAKKEKKEPLSKTIEIK